MTDNVAIADDNALEKEKEALYAEFTKKHSYGFWQVLKEYEPTDPIVREKPHVWRFDEFEPLLHKAAELVPPEEAERRGVVLHNPAYDMKRPFTTNTQFVAYTIINPGEVFTPHIHTPAASRMVLHGNGYTTVQGHKCGLGRGDLIITPNGTWHDHGNLGDDALIWVDMLDIPVPAFFNAYRFAWGYQEDGVAKDMQTPRHTDLYAQQHFCSGGLLPRFAEKHVANGNGSPQMHFKYKHVRDTLDGLRNEEGCPYDGIILDYVDVTTGGPLEKTQNFAMQMLRPGEHTLSHRHTSSQVYVVLEGQGHTMINGDKYEWKKDDVFCLPSYQWHEHVNGSNSKDAILYSVSDSPALKALGLYWEDQKDEAGEISTINPLF